MVPERVLRRATKDFFVFLEKRLAGDSGGAIFIRAVIGNQTMGFVNYDHIPGTIQFSVF